MSTDTTTPFPVSFAEARGLRVAYAEINADASGLPLFLVHGNWSSHVWWELVLRELEGSNVRTIAYDLRGRGDTTGPDNDYRIADHAADLFALADALGAPVFHLAGHSLGSAIAFEAVLERPERIASLAAFAPSWIDGLPAVFNQPHQQHALKNRAVLDRALAPLAPTAPKDALWARCVDAGMQQSVIAAERNLAALTEWAPGEALRAVTVPRVVVSGTLDVLTGGSNARRVADVLCTDLIVYEDVGHCMPLEAPRRCAEQLQSLMLAMSSTDV